MRSLVLFLMAILSLSGDQDPKSVGGGPRTVEDVTEAPKASDMSFGTFDVQEVTFLHGGPGLFRIDGEPVKGTRYPVEAYLYGAENIATVSFEIINPAGVPIGPLVMVREGTPADARFRGMLTVPGEPFRVAAKGLSIDGQPFRLLDDRLFRPIGPAPTATSRWSGLSAEDARQIQQMIDAATPELIGLVEMAVAASPAGAIVMPRMKVSNVTYAPLASAEGLPLGLRIAYDVSFSDRAEYDPALRVEAKYTQAGWDQLTTMRVLNSSVTPTPRYAHAPHDEFAPSELLATPLEAGAHYLYQANTTYHFTADLVPDFVVHNLAQTQTCIYYQRFRFSPEEQRSFKQLLESDTVVPYTVWIGRSAFKGRIPAFQGEGAFHRSFAAAGAQDCGPQPTRRF